MVDPASKHYYQPAWTLVGGGVFDIKKTERNEAEVMPKVVKWLKEKVTGFIPDDNTIQLESGSTLQYEYLVVAAGIQLNWHEIKGLQETLGRNNVCSNYSFEHAPYQKLTGSYNGYTSCPVVTGYGKLVLAEFDYDGKPRETFPFDQSKERRSMYILKRYILPWLYWTKILQGKA